MNTLTPAELAKFTRAYRFAGGRLRRVRVRYRGQQAELDVVLAVRTAIRDLGTDPQPVRLRLRLADVEEFRFQKRPGGPGGKMADVRFGYFNGLFYVNFDAWGLGPGEQPGVHDFRGSDAFAAARVLEWEEVGKEKSEEE
jgi:hypothetical protein